MEPPPFGCERRYFRNHREYLRWYALRSRGFGEWYVPAHPAWSLADNRHVANCKAALFPDFFHQLRTADGEVVGYLATVPGYWSGDAQSLQPFGYIDETLQFDRRKMLALTAWYVLTVEWLRLPSLFERIARRVRASRMRGANAIFLIAIAVDPDFRGQNLPRHLVDAAKQAARRLGYDYVAAPFRPTAYGAYKAARGAAHSDALFLEYCAQRTPEGLPLDPWLRAVVRLGARLVKPMTHSLTLKGPLARFERLRTSFRPADWYTPAPDVWECGETCTWYVDRLRRLAVSVEPNYWGVFDLREASSPPAA